MILRVGLEVLGEVADAIAEKRDLDFRGTCIAVVGFVRADDLGLAVLRKRHLVDLHERPRTRPRSSRPSGLLAERTGPPYVAKLPCPKDLYLTPLVRGPATAGHDAAS